MSAKVKVVALAPAGELARRAHAELKRAGHAVELSPPELSSAEGVLVFVDDPGLPAALARLYQLLPGRSAFPNTILCMEQPERAGGLLGEGFRDVVGVSSLGPAVEALVRGKPPLIFAALRQEIEGDFLPKVVNELRRHAKEKQTLMSECLDLVRAAAHFEERIDRMRKLLQRQATDALITEDGRVDAYLASLDERKQHRLSRLPKFPTGSLLAGVLGKREPRFARSREEIEDAIDWLRQVGFLEALGKAGLEAMNETATTLSDTPLQGLRECKNIVEREIAVRLTHIDRIQAQVDPIAVLEERCLGPHGFGILPPGIAVPEGVRRMIRAVVQPPAELYATWCLDLRDLKVKKCAEVIPEITRELAFSHNTYTGATKVAHGNHSFETRM